MLALAGQTSVAPAAWDETQLQLLRQYSTPVRWYNIEGPPYRVAGAGTHYHFTRHLHYFQLRPGEDVTLRATANSWLRLAGESKILSATDLEISLSTDGRAWVVAAPIRTVDPYSLLIALPQEKSVLIRVTRPRELKSNVVFAAWLSVAEPFDTIAPYRDALPLPGKSVRLRRDDESWSQRAWLIQPPQGIEFRAQGPARLQLVARLPWPIDEPLREQGLVMKLTLDGVDASSLLFSPELDARHRTRANHSTELVSLRMNGFFNVPDGKHVLRLQPELPVYLSVFREGFPDYLFPPINAPSTNSRQALQWALKAGPVDPAVTFPVAVSNAHVFAELEQNAWRLARDNNRLDAGGQAADWLNRIAQARRDYPATRQSSATLSRQRTFYRELPPARQSADQPIRQFSFTVPRLHELFEPQLPVAVYNPTFEQVGDLLATGSFVPVPDADSPPLLYRLPGRSYDSRLRIAALAAGPARTQFFVQFDRDAPVKVLLDSKPALPRENLDPSAGAATLRVLEQEAGRELNRSSGQPIGEFDLAFPIAEPGIVELPLPQRVREVRLYREPGGKPIETSVAYRAAKPFEPGESACLSLLGQTNPEEFLQLLASGRDPGPAAPESLRELHNQFLPLIRLLKAHRADFAKSIDLNSAPPRTDSALAPEEVSRLKKTAETLEREGQPIEALELWNRVFWNGPPAARNGAALATMHCLESLGEDFLAAQYARHALLTAPAREIPADAIALLESNARATDDPDQLEQLRAFLFARCPCPQHLAGLVEAFALNSRDEFVVTTGWLLPAAKQPIELMLASALRLNWWQTFDKLADTLPQPEAKSFWRAQKHLARYQFADATRDLKQAGERGAEMLAVVQEGMRIRDRLGSASLKERLDALFAWEQWQAHQPGARIWTDAEDVVVHCSAGELVFNREQNLFAQYLRAAPGTPVKLSFVGPLRLQIEARPILDSPFEKPVDDWLDISENGITNRVPVFQCVPNPSLQLTAGSNALAGVKTSMKLDWGPGRHEVEVQLAGRAGLIRVLQEKPALPARILPTLNLDRLSRVLANDRGPRPTGESIRHDKELWWVPSELAFFPAARGSSSAMVSASGIGESDLPSTAGLTDLQRLRLVLRTKAEPESAAQFSSRDLQALPSAEQWLAASRWNRWSDLATVDALPEMDQVNYLLATGRIRRLLDSNTPRDARERLVTLLRVADGFPAWRKEAQCSAELLAAGTNCPPGCKNILLRLSQDLTWTPLPISPISAGIRPLDVRFDLAQDPSSRIRRALLEPADTNQFTLSGQNAFSASMTLQRPAPMQLRVELAKAGFSPLAPLNASLQIDAAEIQRFPLSQSEPAAETNFTLTEGTHLVRLWIEDPAVNEFVRIRIDGRSEGATNSIWSQALAQAASENRFFHAATTTQPIRFNWKGPALLRLDEWRDGHFLSQLRGVPEGEQAVEIRPAPGRTESWYRIFVRATQTNQPDVRPAWATREPEELLPPELRLPPAIAPAQAELTDYYRLGGQEDGTWSASVSVVQRRPFELDVVNTVVNKFVEADVEHRKMNADETVWFATDTLGRVHEPGDITLGLAEQIEGRPRYSPLEWNWTGEAFGGWVGSQQNFQAALQTDFDIGPRYQLNRKLDDRPLAGFFARYLTVDPVEATRYTYIDQDLFTPYRYQHRWGWIAGNQLEYRPWLDTIVRVDLGAFGNENFTPDHWDVLCSWNQLLGPVRARLSYRFTHFLADDDRPNDKFRQGISAGVYAEHWFNGCNRVEFGAQYRHDWPDSGDSYFVVLSWDFSRGRGYKDTAPRGMSFRDLRTRRIPSSFNNLFSPGPAGATLP